MEGKQLTQYTMSYMKTELKCDLEDATLMDYLKRGSLTIPDEECTIFLSPDGTRDAVVTYKGIYDNSIRYARAFMALGVKEKDFVAINVRSQAKWLYIYFGLMQAGAIPVPLVFTYKDGSDVLAILKKLERCTTVILDPESGSSTWNIFKSLLDDFQSDGSIQSNKVSSLKYMVCMAPLNDGSAVLTLEELLKKETVDADFPKVAPNAIACLFQTSGSTGIPKLVAHSHRSLIHSINVYIGDLGLENSRNILFNDRPFNWIGGMPMEIINSSITRVTRSTTAGDPTDRIDFVIKAVQQERCNLLIALPPMLHAILDRLGSPGEEWPVEMIFSGGQPISANGAECVGKLCSKFFVGYGSTEGLFLLSTTVASAQEFKAFSCGVPPEGVEMKIVDEKGDTVPVNTVGELYARSNGMFIEYLNDPEKTKAVFTSDGWFKTDDLGRMTENGFFYVEGRKSDMIISGGFNVPPGILEAILKSCDGVENAVIVPIPDENFYQVLCACIIRKRGSDITEESLRSFCSDLHTDKKALFSVLPTYYLFYDTFPETQTGKLFRKGLALESLRRITASQTN